MLNRFLAACSLFVCVFYRCSSMPLRLSFVVERLTLKIQVKTGAQQHRHDWTLQCISQGSIVPEHRFES